ncbi:YxeA family protein [Collinsella tanakaei]|uniref:YxeA family protein n=1 Tax=Collinsella tanakaei TaxID=626935 RepID=UPI0019578A30|nr:YxeA family protein [Collinsella tanakaei]MBM6755682.1 YxeA family protein [Collinsella tanakaei]
MRNRMFAVVALACILVGCGGCSAQGVARQFADELGEVALSAPPTGATYYLQVDNARVIEDAAGDVDMPYCYDLPAWSEDGAETSVVFRTARKLRDGAYLRFDAALLRGMISWEEVGYDELPDAVREVM